jgi:predicted transcriptional regulator
MRTCKTARCAKPKQFPQFWNEEWLEAAIRELDTRAMTPDKRMAYEMTLAANALAVKNENKKIQEAKSEVQKHTVQNLLLLKTLTVEQIAASVGVSVDFVLDIQQKMSA